MAECDYCKQEMRTADSCAYTEIKIGGKWYKRITDYHDVNERCHDCNILNGQVHHPMCDMERCPACGRQMLSCGCDITELRRKSCLD